MNGSEGKIEWTVIFSKKAQKQRDKLPQLILDMFYFLKNEMQIRGPYLYDWPHYGKITGSGDHYHCHLNKGRPTYVVVWQVIDTTIRVIGIKYIGTHENVGYNQYK